MRLMLKARTRDVLRVSHKIKNVKTVNDLGVTFESSGGFKAHIADVRSRALSMSSWLL